MTEVGEGVSVPGMAAEGSKWEGEEPENWVEIEYLDAHGEPIADAKYVIMDLDGNELASGTLDGNGYARVDLEPKIEVVQFYFDDDPEYAIADEFKPIDNPKASQKDEPSFWEKTKATLSDAAEWSWGVVQGDFNEDPSVSQVVVRAVITLIPIVDQIGDVQDILAALKKLVFDKRYDDAGVWFDLVVTLIGCIPEIGTIFKAVAKLLRRQAKALDILKLFRVLNWVGAGNAFRFLKKLRGDLSKHAADVIKQLDGMLAAAASRMLDLRKWVSTSIQRQLDDMVASIDELRGMVPDKVNEVFDFLGKQIDDVLESAKRLVKSGGTRRKHTVRQQKEMPGGAGHTTEASRKTGDRTSTGDKKGQQASDPQCHGGCPIDTSTGAVVEERVDFTLGVSFPFRVTRSYDSARRITGLLGRGWSSNLDESLALELGGRVVELSMGDGTIVPFDPLPGPTKVFNRRFPHLTLARDERGFAVRDQRDDSIRRFELVGDRGRLTSVRDPHGNGIALEYEEERLAWIRHSDGATLRVRYVEDEHDRRTSIVIERTDVGAVALVARYTLQDGLLVEAHGVAAHHLSYEYDRNGRMARWSDNHKTWAQYQYDEEGRCVWSRTADGLYSVDLTYDERERTTWLRNGQGHVTTYCFDHDGKLLARRNPLGQEERYEYDEHDQPVAFIDPLGNAERFERDPTSGLVIGRTDREGNVTQLFYDDDLRVIEVIDALERSWKYERGPAGKVVAVEGPDGATFRYRYSERGQIAEIQRSDGASRTFTYDQRNRLVMETDWVGHAHRYEYDASDRLVTATDPRGHRESLFYDPRDLLVMVRHGDRSEVRFEHDHERLLTAVVDENGHVSRREHGAFDLQRSVTDAEGRSYELEYDPDHLVLVELKAPDGRRYRLERDAAGRVEREVDYGGRATRYRRDAAGNVVERINAAGEQTLYEYDKNGRLIAIEGDGETTRYTYDALGRLTAAESPSARLEREYDALGRLTRSVQNDEVLRYRYDDAGRCVERVLEPGPWQEAAHETKYAHDENGQLRALELANERLELDRDPVGNAVRIRAGGGHALEQGYDERGYLVEQRLVAGAEGAAVTEALHRRYAYDAARNLLEVEDSHWGSTRYKYDRSDRVVEAVRSGGGSEAFGYDANGLLTRARVGSAGEGHVAAVELGERGLPRRLGDDEYEFDEVGRLVSKTVHRRGFRPMTWTFRWDHQNRLVEARTPERAIWRYAYDPLGRRVLKYNPSTHESIHFLWDGDVLLRELHLVAKAPGGMEQVARVVYWHHEPGTFRPLARESDGEAQLVVSDGIGTPVAMVAAGGEIAWRVQRAVWGAELRRTRRKAGDESAVGFPGQYWDEETGLFYNRFRYYDAGLGAYVGPDPLGLEGGAQPWAYVHDPNGWIDPLGLAECGGGGKTFDEARREAFEKAGMEDPSKVTISKYDEATGTAVEFKGPGGAKVGYDGPHKSPGEHHDVQHISWQSGGKRKGGGRQRGNIPYEGTRHPSRPDRKNQ